MSSHHHTEQGQKIWFFSRAGLVACGFLAAIAFLIATGHSAHLLGALPYLLLLACPLMHIFMHGGHGHKHDHSDHADKKSADDDQNHKHGGGCH
jgi:hypothetical protein